MTATTAPAEPATVNPADHEQAIARLRLVTDGGWKAGVLHREHAAALLARLDDLEARAVNEDQAALIAAVVAPTNEDINQDGICSPAWEDLQQRFPVELFRAWAAKNGHPDEGDTDDGYDPEAGW